MEELFKLLAINEWYDGDEFIQIAKGKYELVSDWKGLKNKIKRKLKTK